METINKTNNYTMYKDRLNTGEEFRIALANTINSSIEINVKFNENFAIIEPNKCYISMTNINENKVKDVIMQTWKNIQKQLGEKNFSSKIKIIVNNTEELNTANRIANNSGLRVVIEKSLEYQKIEQEIQQIDKFLKVNTITKIDNGIMKNYTERKADNNSTGYMLEGITNEEMYRKLQELMSDNTKKNIYANMNEEQIANIILDAIALEGNRKKYFLENSREQLATNKMGTVAGVVATKNDGTVNKEIGIIKNEPSKENEINTIEQNGKNVQMITPQINTATISTDKTMSSSYGFNHQSSNDYYSQINSVQNNSEQSNPEEKISEECQQRENNNVDIFNPEIKKGYTKKLTKQHLGREAFISLPVIIFIISGLLLIASAIIFIISK